MIWGKRRYCKSLRSFKGKHTKIWKKRHTHLPGQFKENVTSWRYGNSRRVKESCSPIAVLPKGDDRKELRIQLFRETLSEKKAQNCTSQSRKVFWVVSAFLWNLKKTEWRHHGRLFAFLHPYGSPSKIVTVRTRHRGYNISIDLLKFIEYPKIPFGIGLCSFFAFFRQRFSK